MKATKRSLIISIVILCVCALSLTSASFAWFSASTQATVSNIGLTVDKASDLQISLNGTDWGYSLDAQLDEKINDISTANATSFVEPAERKEVGIDGKLPTTNSGYKTADAGYVDVTVYFKSASPVKVKMSGDSFDTTLAIAPAMRVASIDLNAAPTVFFANTSGTDADVISNTEGALGSVALNAISTGAEIITLGQASISGITNQESDMYYGAITVRYWIEGTDATAINDNSGVSFNHNLSFSVIADEEQPVA